MNVDYLSSEHHDDEDDCSTWLVVIVVIVVAWSKDNVLFLVGGWRQF
jgi:hypothetical protein